jgi:hypothetical protein
MTDIVSIVTAVAPLAAVVILPVALAWALDPSAIPGRRWAADPVGRIVPEREPVRWRTELADRSRSAPRGTAGDGPTELPTSAVGAPC